MTNLEISQAAAPHGLYYAPDPSSQIACSIGGNVAENSGGVHCLKYGLTANNVLGIEMVLMDGEVAITQNDKPDTPYIYRGFKMVDETKLRELRGDVLRTMNQNGMLPLIHAHLFSLQLMREVFAVQVAQGKVPQVTELPTG